MTIISSNNIIKGVRSIATECTKLQQLKSTEDIPCPKPKSIEDIPGPKPSLPVVGTLWLYSPFGPYTKTQMLITAREDLLKEYGPIYKERLGGAYIVNVHDPTHIKEVMKRQGRIPMRVVNQANVYWRKKRPDLYKTVGLVDSIGQEWYELRNKVGPSLLKVKSASAFMDNLSEIADNFVSCVKSETKCSAYEIPDIREYLFRFSLEVIWNLTLGLKLGALQPQPPKEAKLLIKLSMDLFHSFAELSLSRPLWKIWPTSAFRKFCKSEEEIFRLVSRYTKSIINGNENEGTSILRRFLSTKDFDVRDINTVIVDFIAAGIPTTSYFLSLLLHRLGKEKQVQKRLQEELDNAVSDRSKTITEDILKSAPLIQAVMQEGFRLTTIIPCIMRILPENIVCDQYEIPAYTPILCQTRATSVSETYFSRPNEFIPDRWLRNSGDTDDELYALQIQAKKKHFAVLPFGVGPRMCVGKKIAETEIAVFLAKVFLNFSIESEGEVELGNYFIIGPKNEVKIKFTPR